MTEILKWHIKFDRPHKIDSLTDLRAKKSLALVFNNLKYSKCYVLMWNEKKDNMGTWVLENRPGRPSKTNVCDEDFIICHYLLLVEVMKKSLATLAYSLVCYWFRTMHITICFLAFTFHVFHDRLTNRFNCFVILLMITLLIRTYLFI